MSSRSSGSATLPRRHRHAPARWPLCGLAIALLLLALTAVPVSAAGRPATVIRGVHHPIRFAPPPGRTSIAPDVASPVGYIPCDIGNAYHIGSDLPTGAGLRIAIVDAFDEPEIGADLHSFDAALGLPDPTLDVVKPFGQPDSAHNHPNWDLEITLDVEWAHAAAPGAQIDLVETLADTFSLPVGTGGQDLTAGVDYATQVLDDDIVSMSWGIAESQLDSATESQLNGYFPATNAAGASTTYVSSAGDNGFGASWPAIAPGVVGIGGTSLAPGAFGYTAQPAAHTSCSGATGQPGVTSSNETVWGSSQCTSSACLGTGGGPSAFEAKPTWQMVASGSTRVGPDVSMLADPNTGVAMLFEGGWLNGASGGTSLSAPLWAGLVARLDEELLHDGHAPLGVTAGASWVYSANAADFDDVTTGSAPPAPNDPCLTAATNPCVAAAGYDAVTGRGSPLFRTLFADVGGGVNHGDFASFGSGLTATSSPTVASWGPGRLDLFVRGPDNALWHRASVNGSLSAWQSLGGGLSSAPAAVSWGPNRIDVFVRGTLGDLWQIAWDGTSWSGWRELGGQLGGDPTVSSWGVGRLDVFAPSATNGSLMQKAWDSGAGTWSDWRNLGGGLSAGPAAVSWGFNRIDVFGRGTLGDLWHICWCGGWSPWEPHGSATAAARPAAASTGVSRLDVYAPGQDGGLLRMTWTGSAWNGPAAFGPRGAWQFGPAAVSQPGSGRVDLFTVAPDGTIWHLLV